MRKKVVLMLICICVALSALAFGVGCGTTTIEVSFNQESVSVAETAQFLVTARVVDTEIRPQHEPNFRWEIADTSIAKVVRTDEARAIRVQGEAAGSTILTVTIYGTNFSKEIPITVTPRIVATGIEIVSSTFPIEAPVGADSPSAAARPAFFTVNVLPLNATNRNITFEFDDEIISVFPGVGRYYIGTRDGVDIGTATTLTAISEDGGHRHTVNVIAVTAV